MTALASTERTGRMGRRSERKSLGSGEGGRSRVHARVLVDTMPFCCWPTLLALARPHDHCRGVACELLHEVQQRWWAQGWV
eukprot:1588961-Prymnesium_polylepis.1